MSSTRGVQNFSARVPKKKKDAKLEKDLRGFRAIALLSVFSKWYTTVLVHPPHKDEPIEWRNLHVGAERGVNCEHMHAAVKNILQRRWEWQEDRRTDLQPGYYKYNTAFMASFNVKTAFDVAKPSVVSSILTLTESSRTPDGRSVGRNARRSGVRVLRK